MNTKNYEFLRDGLKYMGFGESLAADLEAKIKEQPAEFKLIHQGEYKKGEGVDKISYQLDFRKSNETDMYFFNRYHATLKNEDPSKDKIQTFYINKNTGITAKEAYNLLSGRAVNKDLTNKENQPYNAWLQLDFSQKDNFDNFKVKQYTQGYGYDLKESLAKYPIKEMAGDAEKTRLISSLERGNVHQVTFLKDVKEQKVYIEANPQFKSLNVYDENMKKVFQVNEKKEKNGVDNSADNKETQKQEVNDDDGPGKKSSRKKGIGI